MRRYIEKRTVISNAVPIWLHMIYVENCLPNQLLLVSVSKDVSQCVACWYKRSVLWNNLSKLIPSFFSTYLLAVKGYRAQLCSDRSILARARSCIKFLSITENSPPGVRQREGERNASDEQELRSIAIAISWSGERAAPSPCYCWSDGSTLLPSWCQQTSFRKRRAWS